MTPIEEAIELLRQCKSTNDKVVTFMEKHGLSDYYGSTIALKTFIADEIISRPRGEPKAEPPKD